MKINELDMRKVSVVCTRAYYVLNQKVFELDECPDWAEWAAVDADGKAHWFDSQPRIRAKCWRCQPCSSSSRICFGWLFDATDWQHSLIERPEKVREVTMADLEKKFGCKVKLVKEE